jgi:hypothetical protein
MANPTTNFNWQMPTSTDLVTDLPADFEVFGQAVDTALVDLKGGTTGQLLSKATGTDMDFTWVTPSGGGMSLISTTTLSGSSVTISSIPQTFKNLQFVFRSLDTSNNGVSMRFRFNADSAANRHLTTSFMATSVSQAYNQTYSEINAGATYDASTTSQYVINLWDYTNTVSRKFGNTFFLDMSTTDGVDGRIGQNFISYNQTAAISSAEILVSGGTFTGTVLLYGVY